MAAESSVEQTTIQKQLRDDSCARTAFLSVSFDTAKTHTAKRNGQGRMKRGEGGGRREEREVKATEIG